MPAYESFGRFYDAAFGDRAEAAEHVLKLIRSAKPDARNLLELGCGTGSMLKVWQRHFEVSGLDASPRMLSLARNKVPRAKFFRQEMIDLHIEDRFDVICCVYDTINHLTRFSDWKRVFARVRPHLSPQGCFIFDVNTPRKLERLIAQPPWVHWFGRNLLIMKVTALPRGESNWNVKVFEHLGKDRYALHAEDIVEIAFPLLQITAALRTHFSKVQVIDPDRHRAGAESERLFFIATAR